MVSQGNTQPPRAAHVESAAEPTTTTTTAAAAEQQRQTQRQTQPLPPPLPAPEEGDSPTTVEVNGARVSLLDKLGPAVVNADGTISRIANWAEMTEIERRNTIRVLGARNKLRLEALREGQGGAGGDGGSTS